MLIFRFIRLIVIFKWLIFYIFNFHFLCIIQVLYYNPIGTSRTTKVVPASRLTQASWVKNWLKSHFLTQVNLILTWVENSDSGWVKMQPYSIKRWQMRPKLPSELSQKLTQVRFFDSSQPNFDLSQKIWLKLSKNATLARTSTAEGVGWWMREGGWCAQIRIIKRLQRQKVDDVTYWLWLS